MCGSSHGVLFCYCTSTHIHEYIHEYIGYLSLYLNVAHMEHENSPVNCVLKNKSNCRDNEFEKKFPLEI